MNRWFFFLLLSSALLACQNSTKDTTGSGDAPNKEASSGNIEKLKKETLQLHDEVMSKMNKMAQLRSELKENSSQDTVDSTAMVQTEAQLAGAKDKMMNWMRNFKNPDKLEGTEEEKAQYLRDQRDRMEEIQKYTQQSIQKAEKLLGK